MRACTCARVVAGGRWVFFTLDVEQDTVAPWGVGHAPFLGPWKLAEHKSSPGAHVFCESVGSWPWRQGVPSREL